MTKLLKHAVERLAKLPDEEQDAIAALILQEIEDERLWAEKFRDSRHALEALAEEALAEHRRGETTPLEFDSES